MQKHREITLARLARFASEARLRGKVYGERAPVKLSVYSAPDRITCEEAMKGAYVPAKVGDSFGPVWSTHWFRVEIEIPSAWRGKEVHLLWVSTSEACVWENGEPMQGLTGNRISGAAIRPEYPLTLSAKGGERRTLYVEIACNHLFGLQNFPDPARLGHLKQAEIAIFDREAWDLLWDLVVVSEMARHLPADTPGPARRCARPTRW